MTEEDKQSELSLDIKIEMLQKMKGQFRKTFVELIRSKQNQFKTAGVTFFYEGPTVKDQNRYYFGLMKGKIDKKVSGWVPYFAILPSNFWDENLGIHVVPPYNFREEGVGGYVKESKKKLYLFLYPPTLHDSWKPIPDWKLGDIRMFLKQWKVFLYMFEKAIEHEIKQYQSDCIDYQSDIFERRQSLASGWENILATHRTGSGKTIRVSEGIEKDSKDSQSRCIICGSVNIVSDPEGPEGTNCYNCTQQSLANSNPECIICEEPMKLVRENPKLFMCPKPECKEERTIYKEDEW
jgi:hypothetical protein